MRDGGLTVCATALVAGEDPVPKAAAVAPREPAPSSSRAPAVGSNDTNPAVGPRFRESVEFVLRQRKAQLELKSLEAQVDAKKAEIAQRESERAVKQLSGEIALYNALLKPIPMAFPRDTPLEDFLKHIEEQSRSPELPTGLPIYVDPQGLKAAEMKMTSPVWIEIEGVPLGTTLRLALKQLGLSYELNDGLLTISSEDRLNAGTNGEAESQGARRPAANDRPTTVPRPETK